MPTDHPPFTVAELLDDYTWEKGIKIITRDRHHISGLANLSYFNRLTSVPATRLHYHNGLLEIHCLAKGKRYCTVICGNEEHHYTCTGGQALFVFPGEVHASGDASVQVPCELYALQFDLRDREHFLNLDSETGRILCERLERLPDRHVSVPADSLGLLRNAFSLIAKEKDESRAAGVSYLVCFAYSLLRLQPAQRDRHLEETDSKRPPAEDARILRAIEHITANLTEPLTISELAEVSGYSLSHFKLRFREVAGDTPANYITSRKVELAKKLLLQTTRSVTEIGCDLGWSTGNYFCTVFRKITGMSPLQYRKKHRDDTTDHSP